jgi:hypothetical protein
LADVCRKYGIKAVLNEIAAKWFAARQEAFRVLRLAFGGRSPVALPSQRQMNKDADKDARWSSNRAVGSDQSSPL